MEKIYLITCKADHLAPFATGAARTKERAEELCELLSAGNPGAQYSVTELPVWE